MIPKDLKANSTKNSTLDERFDISIVALFKLTIFIAIIALAIKISTIILLLFLGFLLAVSLDPVIVKLQHLGFKRVYAIFAIAISMAVAIIVTGAIVIPNLFDQISHLISAFPQIKSSLLAKIPENSAIKTTISESLYSSAMPDSATLMTRAVSVLNFILEGISEVTLVLIFSIYLLIDGKRAFKWVSDFFTAPVRLKLQTTAREASIVIYGYVMAQVVTSVIGAIYVYIALVALHVPAAFTLAIIAGVFDILPILGFFIAVIPAVVLAISVSPITGFYVFALYLVYHGIENYLLVPWIYGNRMKVSSLVVLIALLVAGSVGGILGAIAILPVVASYPIIERVWLVKYLGRNVVLKHSEEGDISIFPEQVTVWNSEISKKGRLVPVGANRIAKSYGKKVLIVEDDDDIRTMLGDILETEGYEGVMAANGKEGLDILRQNSDFGLIFLDMMMPIMDGRTFLSLIKDMPEFADIPVVFLSSSVGSVDSSGAAGVLKKPSEIDVVLNIVEKYFKPVASPPGLA